MVNSPVTGGTWGADYLQFNGTSTWVNFGQMHNDYMSLDLEFSTDEIRAQAAPQILWFTIVEIMHKSKSHEEMLWYINKTERND